MSHSTGAARKRPPAVFRKYSLLTGLLGGAAWVGFGVVCAVFDRPRFGGVAGVLVSNAVIAAIGVVIITDAVLGSPIRARYRNFRGAAFSLSCALMLFGGYFSGGVRVDVSGTVLLAVVCGAGIADIFVGVPDEGRPGSIGSRDLPSRVLWPAAGSGAGAAARAGWLAMRITARLMPPAVGRRWLAEARSFLAEAPPALRRRAVISYLASTPGVFIMSWAAVLARRAR